MLAVVIDVQSSQMTLGPKVSTLGREGLQCSGRHQGRLPGESDTGVGGGEGVEWKVGPKRRGKGGPGRGE